MFFEGSEKKAEVVVNSQNLSLLNDISNTFWQELVECCNAQILSSVENEHCKAFLLSESSLFVWDDRFLILTCGVTKLVNSIEYFIQNTQPEDILHVTYQRKKEYFSNAQLKIDQLDWVGHVEIHLKSSDWFAHQHHQDSNYDAVILHLVWEDDVPVVTQSGMPLPSLELSKIVSPILIKQYKKQFL